MLNVKFGKLPARHDYRTLRFSAYVTPQLPKPPEQFTVLTEVYKNLKNNNPAEVFPMDGNDKYGCCTIAALAHADTVYNGLIEKKKIAPEKDVLKVYFRLSGGMDTGLVVLDVLSYWRKHNFSGDKILAYVSIDSKNYTHVKQAINLFGGVYLGFQVQEDAVDDFENNKVWTPGRLTNGGHAVYATGYDAETVEILTWGDTQYGTWDWWNQTVDEAYAIVPSEAKNPSFNPGFNINQLLIDLNSIAHYE